MTYIEFQDKRNTTFCVPVNEVYKVINTGFMKVSDSDYATYSEIYLKSNPFAGIRVQDRYDHIKERLSRHG